jgi:F-type H+-transporting ATPase subunit beta
MTTTDGLKRGDVAVDTGTSIKVQLENQLLVGEPVDECGAVGNTETYSIHRSAPEFVELDTKPYL